MGWRGFRLVTSGAAARPGLRGTPSGLRYRARRSRRDAAARIELGLTAPWWQRRPASSAGDRTACFCGSIGLRWQPGYRRSCRPMSSAISGFDGRALAAAAGAGDARPCADAGRGGGRGLPSVEITTDAPTMSRRERSHRGARRMLVERVRGARGFWGRRGAGYRIGRSSARPSPRTGSRGRPMSRIGSSKFATIGTMEYFGGVVRAAGGHDSRSPCRRSSQSSGSRTSAREAPAAATMAQDRIEQAGEQIDGERRSAAPGPGPMRPGEEQVDADRDRERIAPSERRAAGGRWIMPARIRERPRRAGMVTSASLSFDPKVVRVHLRSLAARRAAPKSGWKRAPAFG